MSLQEISFDALVFEAAEPEDLRPNIREIEETLLAALFTAPETTILILGDTSPGDYYFEEHRFFAAKVYPLLGEGRFVDRVVLEALLGEAPGAPLAEEALQARGKFLAWAAALFERAQHDPPPPGKAAAYLGIFVDYARLKLAHDLIDQTKAALGAGELPPQAAAARALEVVSNLEATRRLSGAFRPESQEFPAYLAALGSMQHPGRDFLGLDTGFTHFNRVANGLGEGLFVLGAAPSMGKTTFAKQLVDQVVTLNPQAACLFVSYEQGRDELRVKTLARLSGIENRDILRGRLGARDWAEVRRAGEIYAQKTAGRMFILEGDQETTAERIRLAGIQVRRASQAEKLLIVIDYLQIVPTTEEYRFPRNRVDAVVSLLRRIARDLKACVVAISAVGRASYEGGDLASFKESGGVEYGADLAAVLQRPPKDKRQRGERSPKTHDSKHAWELVYLDLVKNRNGEGARIGLHFFKSISMFEESGAPGPIEEDGKD